MENTHWNRDVRMSVRDMEGLKSKFSLSESEKAFFEQPRMTDVLPFQVTEYYLSLVGGDENDPIRRQCIPTAGEFHVLDYETDDPLHESGYTPVPRLVHRYRDRALLLVNDTCSVYCRHCFRRNFTGRSAGAVTDTELEAVCTYLRQDIAIQELLLSGGDPLMLGDSRLESVLMAVRSARPEIMFRLATRTPVTLPYRLTGDLAFLLSKYFPLWVVTQFNHPAEITPESTAAVAALRGAGIPVLNQTVLLRGINDNPSVLSLLFRGLVNIGVKPYYIFQGDLASGTGHFRIPIETGWRILEELRAKISGLAIPVYAVDLPGGGGKIPLDRGRLAGETEEEYTFRGLDGGLYTYPKEGSDEQRH